MYHTASRIDYPDPVTRPHPVLLLDWGDTVMRVFPGSTGPMHTWPKVEAVAGVTEVLGRLRDSFRIALATNAADSLEKDIWKALERVGLEKLFDQVYCFRSVGHKKPSPEFFGHILRNMNIGPADAVMVGDEFDRDVLGATAMGLRAVWFNPISSEDKTGPRYRTIHDMSELPCILASWA